MAITAGDFAKIDLGDLNNRLLATRLGAVSNWFFLAAHLTGVVGKSAFSQGVEPGNSYQTVELSPLLLFPFLHQNEGCWLRTWRSCQDGRHVPDGTS